MNRITSPLYLSWYLVTKSPVTRVSTFDGHFLRTQPQIYRVSQCADRTQGQLTVDVGANITVFFVLGILPTVRGSSSLRQMKVATMVNTRQQLE